MLVDIIAGARPNFMKIAPIIHEIERRKNHSIQYRLVHTGQHYDKKMSGNFFEQLGIPVPDVNLESGSGTQAEQTAKIMVRYESLLLSQPCDLTLVVGDVTSTMACSISAKKLGIKVAHVEAGIRSYDLAMPEEINRMITDSITDYFFTTSTTANDILTNLGTKPGRIFFVGNTMIDTLLANLPRLRKPAQWDELMLRKKKYIVLTMHRPSNVDDERKLTQLIVQIMENSRGLPMVFPIHPRTSKIFKNIGLRYANLCLIEPLPYLEFNYLVSNSLAVITDSGGITEETTVLGIPCMTLRSSTERPETCTIGTNELLGTEPEAIAPALEKLFSDKWKRGEVPSLWDGKTSIRIIDTLEGLTQEILSKV